MRPAVKLSYHLVIWQVTAYHRTDNLVRGHAGNPNISSAADTVLRRVFAAHSIIDLFTPKCGVDHNWLAAQEGFKLLKEFSQSF